MQMLIIRETVLGKDGIWEYSVPSAQYFCKLKTVLKVKIIKNRYIRI